MNGIKVKFWGVRGSFPIPKSNDTFGGNTSCIEVRSTTNEVVLFDMGTGLRNFGNSLLKEKEPITDINIVLSHFHYDHILGFLMFIPLFIDKYNINIFAPGKTDAEVEEKFESFLSSNFWPVNKEMMSAKINFNHYSSEAINITNNIKVLTSPHGHPGGASSIRLEIDRFSVTYVTDCEHPSSHLNQNVIDIANNTDLLIHDAQYTPEQMPDHKGWGHSSWEHCVEVAQKARAKRLALFHHNPDHGDSMLEAIEQDAKNVFTNTVSAREGMELFIPEEVSETVA
tara:strand:+ start:2608 stop:3459 length:852 start_codon:yes stop_codon:yes gene_type:complete